MVILFWVLTAALTAIDRLTKAAAVSHIQGNEIISVISAGDTEILAFSMHRNTGAAFSSFTGKTAALAVVTAVAMVLITVYFHMHRHKHPLMTVSYAMVVGGGIGNFIDRVCQGYVTDFIRLFPFNFIFNFADICVVVGAILLVLYYLFIDEKYQKRFDKTAEDDDGQ